MNQWYEAESARSNRSKCKTCKETIDEGSLRIGIKIEEDDHWGSSLGWFHPDCLWKTFNYSTNANPRITAVTDVTNFDTLYEEDQVVIRDLIAGKSYKRQREVAAAAPLSPSIIRGSLGLKRTSDGSFECTGDTFHVKDVFKKEGAKWNGATKAWVFPATAAATVKKLFGLSKTPLENERVVCEACIVIQNSPSDGGREAAAGVASASRSAIHIPAPSSAFAMAGTAVFKLDRNQNIILTGHIHLIADKLRAEGGSFTTARGGSCTFPTTSRAGARRFLCMPDDLPPADTLVEIDLAELGRKHAQRAGLQVSEADQERAEERLRLELRRQDNALLQDAKAAIAKIVPSNSELSSRRSSKRPRRATAAASGDAAVAASDDEKEPELEEVLKRNSIRDLSYEERLELDTFTIPYFKDFLAARGLPTSGGRADLEARFLLAGMLFATV
jgi:hypothetical protein